MGSWTSLFATACSGSRGNSATNDEAQSPIVVNNFYVTINRLVVNVMQLNGSGPSTNTAPNPVTMDNRRITFESSNSLLDALRAEIE